MRAQKVLVFLPSTHRKIQRTTMAEQHATIKGLKEFREVVGSSESARNSQQSGSPFRPDCRRQARHHRLLCAGWQFLPGLQSTTDMT